jgi:DNA polymerase-3 subunit beta
MFLKVNRDEIIEGLQKSANIIPVKTGAAFLRTIWLKAEAQGLKIMATDSNLEFCGAYPALIEEEGLAGIQGRSFYDLIRRLPSGEILIKSDPDGAHVLIEQGSRKYKLPVNDPTWFQNFSEFPETGAVFWSGDFLHEIIDRVSFCVSDEDSMEAIACLNLAPVTRDGGKVVEACGMNGHQFSMFTFTNDDVFGLLPSNGALIQKKYLMELKKWLTADEIELILNEKRLFFRTGDKKETFSLPLSYYQYPNYHNFIDKLKSTEVSSLATPRTVLMDSLERISIFNDESNRCAHFMFSENELTLYSQGQERGTGTESVEARFTGSLEKIAFPTRVMIEVLSHFNSKEARFTLTGGEAPCGITGAEDPNYLVIVMPMKIQEETYYSEEEA